MQQLNSEKLIVETCIENSYEKALQAFTLNKTVLSMNIAKAVLVDAIEANKWYWSDLREYCLKGLSQNKKIVTQKRKGWIQIEFILFAYNFNMINNIVHKNYDHIFENYQLRLQIDLDVLIQVERHFAL